VIALELPYLVKNRILTLLSFNSDWDKKTSIFGIRPTLPNQNRYIKYFGNLDKSRLAHVRKGYQSVKTALSGSEIKINACPDPKTCEDGAAAYVFPGGEIEIFICVVKYFSYSDEMRGSFILHEMTHEVHGTDDKHNGKTIYGDLAVQGLAKTDPSTAVTTADNYAWFAMGLK
jgi:hypothetical protein